ncbi:T9SS type A sorting domain-containing protein, partial [Dyadobacter sp. CY351]|uniref:T9SS type A sorting domain-containing protein n=1 Tax=Dyadobacter sp. CY351 TaxID=2909337 RepID=UPI001F25C5E2
VYGTVIANQYRADLKDQGKGTGNYGFTIPIPAGLKDGATHTLNVRVKGKSYIVPTAAPRTLMCPANVYAGNFDIVDCNSARGWVWDKNNSSTAVTVELYEGSTVYATGLANIYKETLKNEGKGTGNYGFSLPIPASLKDGMARSLSIRVKGSTYTLGSSSRSLTCASSARIAAMEEMVQDDKSNNILEIGVWPNPTRETINLDFYLEKGESANLSIVNMLGQQIWQKSVIGVGKHIHEGVNLSQHADGVYLVNIKSNTKSESRRVVLAK